MIAAAVAAALLCAAAAPLLRLVTGPTAYDRALAVHAILLLCIFALGALAVAARRPAWIDLALALTFVDLIVVAAVTKALRLASFQPPLAPTEGEQR